MQETNGWVFTVNGQYINVAADKYSITETDQILWCAYNNSQNMSSYKFPESTKKEQSKTEVKVGSQTQSQNKVDVNQIIDSIKIQEHPTETGQSNQDIEEQSQSEPIVNNINNETNSIVQQTSQIQETDYTTWGYLGIIITFILLLSYIKLMKGRDNNEKD